MSKKILIVFIFVLFLSGCTISLTSEKITQTTKNNTTNTTRITNLTSSKTTKIITTRPTQTTISKTNEITTSTTTVTTSSSKIILPDLTGKNREEIQAAMSGLDIKYKFLVDNSRVYTEDEYDKFVKYSSGLKAGQEIEKGRSISIYTSCLPLGYTRSNEVILNQSYIGKSFIDDGIGEVSFVRGVDGDTAYFEDLITGEVFKLRFLGVDTPESTMTTDPWGKAASKYTTNILSKAHTIVLEGEGSRKETYGRYLGFVWVDGKLLNLMLVEEAYSNSTLDSSSKYYEYFIDVEMHVMPTGRRFFGEKDPNYNYE